ncbi:MAG: hypothetical protein WC584_03135 [Candidatus Pacearchaeota archaeon]
MGNKRGMEMEFLSWWIIGIAILIIMVIAIFILKDKGISAIDYLKNLLRFGK